MKKTFLSLFTLLFLLCLPQAAFALEDPSSVPIQAESGRGLACLSEVMTKNKAAFRDPDGDFSDWVEIRNTAGRDLDLEGWSLSKNGGKSVWVFPSCTLRDPSVRPGARLHSTTTSPPTLASSSLQRSMVKIPLSVKIPFLSLQAISAPSLRTTFALLSEHGR